MEKIFEPLNDPTVFLELYAEYEAMSNHEVASKLWPVMETWSMARLSEDTGISRNTLSRYTKLAFLNNDDSPSLQSKPTFMNYMKIMAAGNGDKTPWLSRIESYLEEHPATTFQQMLDDLGVPSTAVRRFNALYPDRLRHMETDESRRI